MAPSDSVVESRKEVKMSVEKSIASAWRKDAPGIFFALLLALWFLVVTMKITEGTRELWPIFASFLLFEGSNKALAFFIRSNEGLFQGLASESRSDFLNTSISLLHSTLVSLSVVGLIMREAQVTQLEPMLSHDVLFSKPWEGAYTVLAASCGYFAYDQWDMLRKHLYTPRAPSLLVHHAVLLACFTPALFRNVTVNYLILTLVCEVHSVFLHLRKVRKLSGVRTGKSTGVTVIWVLNWTAFVTTRVCLHILITLKLIFDASKFPKGIEWPMAFMGMLGLNLLNVLLGQGLYKAFKKERSNVRHKS